MRLLFLSVLILILPSNGYAQNTELAFQKIVDSSFLAHPETIGLLVHIESPHQNISWSYTTGKNGINNNEKLNSGQPLLIASNTKPYIAATILKLIEKKKMNLRQPLKDLLTSKTSHLLSAAGYDLNTITLFHLMSHTSGIRDYVTESYFSFISTHKNYNWTRDEQIILATKEGKPLAQPGSIFKYADINYVLLSEIIEQKTGKPFYEAVHSLLELKKHHLTNTWFVQLEKKPENSLLLVNQYWSSFQWEIKDINPSWDLYGGGGMASNVYEMAKFFQLLFNGQIIKDQEILKLMYTDVSPDLDINYCLGIRKIKAGNMTEFNHGGGLGTDVSYIPELNATISIASVDAAKRNIAVDISKILALKLKSISTK
ncbi:hypothetical protein CEY12_03540 [Chryseobacterium sp. T16E-39]|uniref:serine hydrolase domain-containing protein n=1 Tax=Chryseobacterium sp. T16E-39 TaxID=2015076 RepID=UPI000B5B43B6|nr:serine hydrolase domain-containing protein [Chryseobacterium sp. T16E-39]ASK29232.1 hypothetical protein CEY12_03540 [Chryseobacterium sp. T16E-39]